MRLIRRKAENAVDRLFAGGYWLGYKRGRDEGWDRGYDAAEAAYLPCVRFTEKVAGGGTGAGDMLQGEAIEAFCSTVGIPSDLRG